MFLWRHFHLREKIDNEPELDNDENEDSNEELIEIELNCVERENNDTEEGLYEDDVGAEREKTEVWFHKVQPLINYVRDVSMGLIWALGT